MTRWKRRAAPSWNVAPAQDVPIITEKLGEGAPERHLLIARWGLMPSWAKDVKIGSKLINARSETILEKPSFRKAAVKRRALVPAEGYYEWEKTADGKKIPNYLYSEKEELLAFAGLYEFWPDPSLPEDDPGRWVLSCTVLTTTGTTLSAMSTCLYGVVWIPMGVRVLFFPVTGRRGQTCNLLTGVGLPGSKAILWIFFAFLFGSGHDIVP
jgi:putative SOS response-associated peptidase YedK